MKRSGSASTSPTVQPSNLFVVERQDDVGQQDALALVLDHLPRGGHRHARLARDHLLRLGIDIGGANFRHGGREPLLLLRLQLLKLRGLDDRQRREQGGRIERDAARGDRPPAFLILHDGLDQERRAFEHQAFRTEYHAVDRRALEQGAGLADHHPA